MVVLAVLRHMPVPTTPLSNRGGLVSSGCTRLSWPGTCWQHCVFQYVPK